MRGANLTLSVGFRIVQVIRHYIVLIKVRVRGWVMYFVSKGPHKYRSILFRLCVCVRVCARACVRLMRRYGYFQGSFVTLGSER